MPVDTAARKATIAFRHDVFSLQLVKNGRVAWRCQSPTARLLSKGIPWHGHLDSPRFFPFSSIQYLTSFSACRHGTDLQPQSHVRLRGSITSRWAPSAWLSIILTTNKTGCVDHVNETGGRGKKNWISSWAVSRQQQQQHLDSLDTQEGQIQGREYIGRARVPLGDGSGGGGGSDGRGSGGDGTGYDHGRLFLLFSANQQPMVCANLVSERAQADIGLGLLLTRSDWLGVRIERKQRPIADKRKTVVDSKPKCLLWPASIALRFFFYFFVRGSARRCNPTVKIKKGRDALLIIEHWNIKKIPQHIRRVG